MLIRIFIIVFLTLLFHDTSAQRDANWVLGDSVGINFNTNPPTIDTNRIIESAEASASISDDNGNLLFYVAPPESFVSTQLSKFVVRSMNDSIMLNGDSLTGHYSMTQGTLIIPDPVNLQQYYIFHIGFKLSPIRRVLSYSKVDMSLNGGLGMVTLSNVILADTVSEKLTAVKAANGIDWWVIFTKLTNGQLCKFKVNGQGITSIVADSIYFGQYSGGGQLIFSKNGDRLAVAGLGENSLVLEFNRCTGRFSNSSFLDTNTLVQNSQSFARYGCAFSANGQFVYLGTVDSLWQFDLSASNIMSSRQTIYAIPTQQGFPPVSGAMYQFMLGPDDKIYIANASNSPDSLSSHLSVINLPNNPGSTCDFLPYSFSLNGRQSYAGLPNMVNYTLGVWEGGNCDSILAGVFEKNISPTATCFPNPAGDEVSFTLPESERLESGKIYSSRGQLILEFDTSLLSLKEFPAGIYIYRIKSVVDKFYFGKIIKY